MVDGALLVGDIGGTHARFAVAEADGRLRDIMVLRVADYRTFADALAAYVQTQSSAPQAACLALAGVVENGQVTVTNSGWVVHAEAIEKQHGFTKVHLINDFEAQAYFAGAMTAHSYLTLKDGKPVATAPLLVMGPGTGFGQALWIPGAPPCVLSTEGGYRSFPISSERDRALADKLGQQLGYPPVLEDVVSGRGLSRLAALLSGGPEVPPETLSAQALKSPGTARDAVFWFIELLARAAADACFSTGARGGVVISGGIVPRFAPLLSDANFRHHFVRPGPLAPYLGQVPVRLVTNTTAALIGAAAAAQLVS